MHTAHDPYARLLLDQIFSGHGSVVQEYPLPPSPTRRADLVFVPGPTRPEAVPLGAMARIAVTPCLLEAFSAAPGMARYERVLGKTLEARRQALRLRATPQQRTLRDAVLWMLCAGHPRKLLRETRATPIPDAPAGFYTLGAAHPVCIVSLGELPETDDTLLLRLLAKRLVRRSAQAALRARALADPRLVPLLETMIEYTRRLALDPDEEGEEVMVDLTEVRKWTASVRQEGRQEGLMLGLLALVRLFERRLGRPLSEAERATLGARVDTLGPERLGDVVLDLDPDALGHWLGDPEAR